MPPSNNLIAVIIIIIRLVNTHFHLEHLKTDSYRTRIGISPLKVTAYSIYRNTEG